MDALLNLEGTDRFRGIGGFVNVSRHRDNLLVNGLGAFLFGKKKNSSSDAINVRGLLSDNFADNRYPITSGSSR